METLGCCPDTGFAFVSSLAWFVARTNGASYETTMALGKTAFYALCALGTGAAYAGAVGVYHTFLSLTGLDRD